MSIHVSGIGIVAPGLDGAGRPLGAAAPLPGENWFDPVPYLGARGWKYHTPATRYLLAAANVALDRPPGGPRPAWEQPERVGVVTGTHHAIGAMHARLDHTIRHEGISGLSPAELPGFSVNIPASQLAIALACRAFSVTFTNPVVSGLEAVSFAVAAIRRGRADRVLATATEEASLTGTTHGGAAVLLLEASPTGTHPQISAGVSRFIPLQADGTPDPRALAAATRRVTGLVGGGGHVRYAFCGPKSMAPVDEAVQRQLAGRLLGSAPTAGADTAYGAVSPLLQLANMLRQPEPGLLLATSAEGHLVAVATRREET